ncbi:hypothetical protein PF010_g20821 [Phytophthora fragariae]|uniref:Uncharacterized protein n=1 Tax=Phytophthora fragariae TaxID=53985 RepID=A0A6G0KE13_9STRA|nr:hypothetical protein PF010_g20821 [Phytophthora fragariae]
MGQNVDLPDPSGLAQHTLSGSAGPRRARKMQRTAAASSAARNTPSSRSQSPVRKSPAGGAMADEDDDVGSIGGGSPSSPHIDRSDEGASSADEGSPDQDGSDAPPAEEASPDDEASPSQEDDADEEMLGALSRSRSSQRRRSSSISGTGSASQPLVVRGSGAGPGGSPESPSDDSGDAEPNRVSDDGQGGDLPADEDYTSAGHDNSAEIDEDDEASLPSTTVPRGLWIPGYRVQRLFRTADVAPWDVDKTSLRGCSRLSLLRFTHIPVRTSI